jgi:glycosyl transferase family 25
VFVLTLSKEKGRQQNMEEQLKSMNIPFEFVFGVDGRKMPSEKLLEVYNEKKCNRYYFNKYGRKERGMVRGEICCALSHKLIYNKMVENNINRAVVFEDDILIHSDFLFIKKNLQKLPLNNYIIKFDIAHDVQAVPWHKITINDNYYIQHILSPVALTWGYYIDIKAARNMLRQLQEIFLVIDEWDYYKSFVKLRVLNKAIVSSKGFESIINNEVEEKVGFNKTYYNRFGSKYKYVPRFIRMFHKLLAIIITIFR